MNDERLVFIGYKFLLLEKDTRERNFFQGYQILFLGFPPSQTVPLNWYIKGHDVCCPVCGKDILNMPCLEKNVAGFL